MTDKHQEQSSPLASLLSYAEREAARRAKGTPAGTTRLRDDELEALLDLLRREVGTAVAEGATGR